jgi:hypothetical protein
MVGQSSMPQHSNLLARAPLFQLVTTDFRFGGIQWGNEKIALVYESWYKTRRSITRRFSPGDRTADPIVMFDRYYEVCILSCSTVCPYLSIYGCRPPYATSTEK